MPRLLDLFCGGGGAGMGYSRAGFEVVGVDIKPQSHYPFAFILGDALDVLARMLKGEKFLASDGRWYGIEDFDAIHASPVCKGYTRAWNIHQNQQPRLIEQVRQALIETGKLYVIENVVGAPLINPVMLTGAMFGMNIKRDRLFECNFPVEFVLSPTQKPAVKMGRKVKEGDVLQPVGNFTGVEYAGRQMDIDWMVRSELSQAVPPVYTFFIGKHLLEYLKESSDAR
jgi:DNA (cytosine-5)-methyltransferase 1